MVRSEEAVDVVVGAGSGMGEAVARRLQGGRRLLLADVDGDAAAALAAGLGDGVEAAACDVSDAAACASLASRVGRLGSLVLTAGLSPTMATGERIFAVNLAGAARVLDAFDDAVAEGTAAVVFASTAAHIVVPPADVAAVLDDPRAPDLVERLRAVGVDTSDSGTAYAFSKAGVIRLVRRTAGSWWGRGARIVSLSPGIIDTPMGRQELAQQPMMQGMVDLVGRFGSADEVAAVVEFLVSGAASFITGSDVAVDGGFLAMAGAG